MVIYHFLIVICQYYQNGCVYTAQALPQHNNIYYVASRDAVSFSKCMLLATVTKTNAISLEVIDLPRRDLSFHPSRG